MIDPHSLLLLLYAVFAVVSLVVLVAVAKLNPFLGLFLVSLALGIASGMPAVSVIHSFEAGVGATLGHIAVVVALGTMLGKMMAESGGSNDIARTLIRWFGERRVSWAMMVIGFIVGLPVFFEVGFVLLIPIVFTVARRTRTSLILAGLPMVAAISVVHGMLPPHPGAMMVATIFRVDVGRMILYGILVGVPAAVLAGPVYARFIDRHVQLAGESPMARQLVDHGEEGGAGFAITLFTILLPVVLILMGSWADLLSPRGSGLNHAIRLAGDDDIALLIGVLVSFRTLGSRCGFTRETVLRFTEECLAPTALITLLVGAGGGFGRVLLDSGVSKVIVAAALGGHLPLIVLAWLIAALMRLSTGSSTVAMTTAAGIVAPLAQHAGVHPELLAIATGAGSLIFSHVNDGGFWLVKEYLNLSVPQTILTWSIAETIISVTALVLTLGLSWVL